MASRIFILFTAAIKLTCAAHSDDFPFFRASPTTVMRPGSLSSVRVFHSPRDPRAIRGIMREGMLTPEDLLKKGIQPRGEWERWAMPQRMETLFFHAPLLPHPELGVAATPINPSAPWVAIDVDPWTSFVFNGALWDDHSPLNEAYWSQKISLAQWLQLRHAGLGTARIHPYTGEGVKCVDDHGEPRNGPEWQGQWELLVRGRIPPENIAGFSYGVPSGSLYPLAKLDGASGRAKARLAAYFLRFMTRGRG